MLVRKLLENQMNNYPDGDMIPENQHSPWYEEESTEDRLTREERKSEQRRDDEMMENEDDD